MPTIEPFEYLRRIVCGNGLDCRQANNILRGIDEAEEELEKLYARRSDVGKAMTVGTMDEQERTLFDIAKAIQLNNDEIEQLEEENARQIDDVWGELLDNLSLVSKFIEDSDPPNCRRCSMLSGPKYGPERDAYDRYCILARSVLQLFYVLENYTENTFLRVEKDKVVLGGEWTCFGETDCLSARFPVEWLSLPDGELLKSVEDAMQKAEDEAERNIAVYEAMREEKERARYEELKAKYGN